MCDPPTRHSELPQRRISPDAPRVRLIALARPQRDRAELLRDELVQPDPRGFGVLRIWYDLPSGCRILASLYQNRTTPARSKNNFLRNETTLGTAAVPTPLQVV